MASCLCGEIFFWLRLSRATFSKVRQRRPEQLELLFQDGLQLTCFSQVSFAPDPLHLERRVERSIGVQRSQPAFECVRGFAEPFSVPSCYRVAHLRQIARTALEEQIYKPAQEFLVPVNGCQERLGVQRFPSTHNSILIGLPLWRLITAKVFQDLSRKGEMCES